MEQKPKEARRQWRRLLAAEQQTCPPPLFKSGRLPILFFNAARKAGPSHRRTLLSVVGSGGLQESNDRRSGEMAPRSAETSFQTSFSSPSSASFAPFSFFASLRGTRRPRKISRRRLRGWAFQFRAASWRLGCRNVFTRSRRRHRRCYACARHFLLNGEMWCWFRNRLSRFLFSIFLPRGYLVFLGSTYTQARG